MCAVTLHDIAEITSGFTIRDRDDLLPAGPVRVLQLRSFDGPTLDLTEVDYLARVAPARKNLLSPGDLVVRSRGRFAVGLFGGDHLPTVASAPLLVIRLLSDHVLPAYVAWLLNDSPEARAHFGRSWQGTTVPAITIADLRRIPLPIPPIEVQQRIADASALIRQEHRLTIQLSEKRRSHHNALLAELAKRTAKEQ